MEVGSLTGRVEIDTGKTEAELKGVKTGLEGAAKAAKAAGESVAGAKVPLDQLAGASTRVRDNMRGMITESGNLGRYFRVLTTSIFGVNAATIAVGTALGNVATQIVSRVVIAVGTAVLQFSRLQNQLAEIVSLAGSVGQSFRLITTTATETGASIEKLGQQYMEMVQQAEGSLVPLEKINQLFEIQAKRQAALKELTIASAATTALDQFGQMIRGLDNLLGISKVLAGIFKGIALVFEQIAKLLPETVDPMEEWRTKLNQATVDLAQVNFALTKGNMLTVERIGLEALKRNLLKDQATALEKLAAASNKETLAKTAAMADINHNLEFERNIGNHITAEQEVQNRMFAIKNQLISAGYKELTKQTAESSKMLAILEDQVRLAMASQKFQGIRESLRGPMQAENESYQERMANLRNFFADKQHLNQEYMSLERAEWTRHYAAVTMIQLQQYQIGINAAIAAAQSISNVLSLMGEENKAAAKAALAINTAVAVAQAIMANEAAAMQALAVPPAPNWGYYGLVKAFGAVQVAGIIAAGAMQIKNVGKGGGGGNPGGGAVTPTGPETTETAAPLQGSLHIEGVDPAMIYTGEQLIELIKRMNGAVSNGATLISTRNIRV